MGSNAKIVANLCCVETWKLGESIVPVANSLIAVAPIFFLYVFFFGAATTASFALTENSFLDTLINVVSMGFAVEYQQDLFLQETDTGLSWSWFGNFIMFALFGFLGWVTLNNIILTQMGTSFDHYYAKAKQSYVRFRAQYGLRYVLLFSAYRDDDKNYLWFCV